MDYDVHDFRDAQRLLERTDEFTELTDTVERLTRQAVIGRQRRLADDRGSVPVGGQSALNSLFETHLTDRGWRQRCPVFHSGDLPSWKLDFCKNTVGLEIAFEHQRYLTANLASLTVSAGPKRPTVVTRTEVGVVVLAKTDLKAWSKMDSSVATYEQAIAWLDALNPLLPAPLLLVGLAAAEGGSTWEATDAFPGRS